MILGCLSIVALALIASCASPFGYRIQNQYVQTPDTAYVSGFTFIADSSQKVYEACGNPYGCAFRKSRIIFVANDTGEDIEKIVGHEVLHLILGKFHD